MIPSTFRTDRAVAREAGPARQAGGRPRPPGGGRQRTLSFWMMVVTGLPIPFAADEAEVWLYRIATTAVIITGTGAEARALVPPGSSFAFPGGRGSYGRAIRITLAVARLT